MPLFPRQPQTFSVRQGDDTPVTIRMSPPQSIDGWVLQFRAKTAAFDPPGNFTVLFEDVNDTATSIRVESGVGFPYRGDFSVRIDDEILYVSVGPNYYVDGRVERTWTVERGAHGTTPAEHLARARVERFVRPQILYDNGAHGGLTVEDADAGIITIDIGADVTAERPAGVYSWSVRRLDAGLKDTVASGYMHVLPAALSGLDTPVPAG